MTIKKYIPLAFVVLAVAACSSSEQLPINTTVRISPTEKTFHIAPPEDGVNRCSLGHYQDIPLLISVEDEQGSPVGGVDVGVYVDFTANTYSGPDVLRLFYDRNGNGVVDEETEFVSAEEDGAFISKTHRYNGNLLLILRINLSCVYRGNVFAYAGPYSSLMPVSIEYETAESHQSLTYGSTVDGQ